jgi:hypothetical protein
LAQERWQRRRNYLHSRLNQGPRKVKITKRPPQLAASFISKNA